jgi:hypothetical protein
MDIQKAFTFQFDDPAWINKLGLGALVTIIPVLNFAWTGYMVELLRDVMRGDAEPLPQWENWEKKFIDGLILFAAGLIYALPVLLALGIPVGLWISSGVLAGSRDLRDISGILAGAGGLIFVTMLCFFLLYGLALSIIYPAILIMFARQGTFASCFQLGKMFRLISANSGPYFTAWAAGIVAGIVVGMLVGLVNAVIGWIPCIGWAASLILGFGVTVYLTTLYAHLYGQFARLAYGGNEFIAQPEG